MSGDNWHVRDFAEGSDAGRLGRSSWRLTLFFILLIGVFASAVGWASWARIEEVARASGRVIPSGKARTVESLEGGIILEILVAEGDPVEAGQILVRMDDTTSTANLGELRAQQDALRARNVRFISELSDAKTLNFDELGIPADGPLALREIAIFDSRNASFFGQRTILNAQLRQRQLEIAELETAGQRVEESLGFLKEEIDLKTGSGVVPRTQILPLERERSVKRQELDSVRSQYAQAVSAEQEAQARREEVDLQRRAEISLERSDTVNQLDIISETIRRASSVVGRAALRAPVTGIVSRLNVNTIGAVISPGEEVLLIVPQDDRLQIEARVRPEDVAFLRPELPAKVKLTSFDFTIYGALEGKVVRIGADAQQDEATGEIYFPIIVETDEKVLTHKDQSFPIRPGMVASVDILTGERTVLDYLLKPFRKAQLEALRER